MFISIYTNASRHVPVLVAIRPVHAGAVIEAADLGTYELSGSGNLPAIPVGIEGSVVGSTATVSIEPGTLIVEADISRTQPLSAGTAIVGTALKVGQFPVTGVVPGQHVMVVATGTSCSSALPGSLQAGPNGNASTPLTSGPLSVDSSGQASAPPDPSSAATGILVPDAEVYAVASPTQNNSIGASALVSLAVPIALASPVAECAAAGDVSVVILPRGGGS